MTNIKSFYRIALVLLLGGLILFTACAKLEHDGATPGNKLPTCVFSNIPADGTTFNSFNTVQYYGWDEDGYIIYYEILDIPDSARSLTLESVTAIADTSHWTRVDSIRYSISLSVLDTTVASKSLHWILVRSVDNNDARSVWQIKKLDRMNRPPKTRVLNKKTFFSGSLPNEFYIRPSPYLTNSNFIPDTLPGAPKKFYYRDYFQTGLTTKWTGVPLEYAAEADTSLYFEFSFRAYLVDETGARGQQIQSSSFYHPDQVDPLDSSIAWTKETAVRLYDFPSGRIRVVVWSRDDALQVSEAPDSVDLISIRPDYLAQDPEHPNVEGSDPEGTHKLLLLHWRALRPGTNTSGLPDSIPLLNYYLNELIGPVCNEWGISFDSGTDFWNLQHINRMPSRTELQKYDIVYLDVYDVNTLSIDSCSVWFNTILADYSNCGGNVLIEGRNPLLTAKPDLNPLTYTYSFVRENAGLYYVDEAAYGGSAAADMVYYTRSVIPFTQIDGESYLTPMYETNCDSLLQDYQGHMAAGAYYLGVDDSVVYQCWRMYFGSAGRRLPGYTLSGQLPFVATFRLYGLYYGEAIPLLSVIAPSSCNSDLGDTINALVAGYDSTWGAVWSQEDINTAARKPVAIFYSPGNEFVTMASNVSMYYCKRDDAKAFIKWNLGVMIRKIAPPTEQTPRMSFARRRF